MARAKGGEDVVNQHSQAVKQVVRYVCIIERRLIEKCMKERWHGDMGDVEERVHEPH